ncbi:MAG: cupin-like domain-containing protein [Bacteroidetes bacterium]|nr:cupin-like domain-containing protein [Bacteroidota bacterium]
MMQLDKIPSIDGLKLSNFKNYYLENKRPVVIRNLTKGTFAEKNWNYDYFINEVGNLEIELIDEKSCDKDSSTAYTKGNCKMKFEEYLTILKKNEFTSKRIFLLNLFKVSPKLGKDFPCPKIMKGILGKLGYMFFGSKNTDVRLHYDIDMSDVLLTHFGGKKKVILVSPEYSKYLYRLPFTTFSLVDLNNPDYQKYPALNFVKGQECILEHGDSLYIPSGYWHYISYIDAGFSVSYRKLPSKLADKISGLVNICVLLPLDKIIYFFLANKWKTIKEKWTISNSSIQSFKSYYPA